jgi:hypothetical protein
MPLQLGDKNDSVRQWRIVMAKRFAGYARTVGDLPADTDVFGARAQAWQKEYERRLGRPQEGIVSDYDLGVLGVPVPRPVHRPIYIFSAPGSGVTNTIGPPNDVGQWAQDVLHINHRRLNFPVGGYMGLMGGDPGLSYNDVIHAEGADLELQITQVLTAEGLDPNNPDTWANTVIEFWFAAYSQSADGMAVAVNRLFGDGGRFEKLRPRINGLLLFGNPARQPGPTKVGNSPVGWGISRKVFPAWLNALTWSITAETPGSPDFYAACDDEIRPLFYEVIVQAATSLSFFEHVAKIAIPILINTFAPFLGGLGKIATVVATPILAAATGLQPGVVSSAIDAANGPTDAEVDAKLQQLLSVQGVLTNIPGLIHLMTSLPGIQTHGSYYDPHPEFGGRTGIQVACDAIAAFRR